MSTRSYIGMKKGNNIKYIYCHSDGYLSYVGVLLYLFYKSPERVKSLLDLGDLSSIGYNIGLPKRFKNWQEAQTYYCYMQKHIKTTFCLFYGRDREESGCKMKTTKFKDFCKATEVSMRYYFDLNDNKWYTTFYNKNSEINIFCLDNIFNDSSEYSNFIEKTNYYEDYQTIKNVITDLELDMTLKGNRTIIGQYNEWLKTANPNIGERFEFGYASRNGNRFYALLSTKDNNGEKRGKRKVEIYSSCIGDLIVYLYENFAIKPY